MKFNQAKAKSVLIITSWSLYDFANQFFLLNVLSLYFVRWLTIAKNAPEIYYSLAFGASTFFVALASPILGTISDLSQRRRPFLGYLTLLSVIFTMLLGFNDGVILSLVFFAIANFGCQTAVVVYNAMLADIAPRNRIGLVSGLGRVFAYTGAIAALYLIKPLILKSGFKAAFFPSGLAFLIFSLPCLIFVKDKIKPPVTKFSVFFQKEKIWEIFANLKVSVFRAKEFSGLMDFLKAVFFCLCAVNAVTLFMSVYMSKVFGLNESQIITLVAFSTLFAILGSLVSGVFGDCFGHKRSMMLIFILWTACFFLAAFAVNIKLYWLIGSLVGLALGGTWAIFRALVIKLVPQERVGEVFGLFNLAGYLAGITGVLFWGVILYLLAPLGAYGYRIAILSLTPFMALGFIFILRIPNNHK